MSERVERICGNCGLVYIELEIAAKAAHLNHVCPRCHVLDPRYGSVDEKE